jgi:hypothetical protein
MADASVETMTPKRWRQVEEIFQAALDRDASTRQAFLDRMCADDAELRREVESLLGAHQPDGGLLVSSALKHVARDLAGDIPRLLRRSDGRNAPEPRHR